MHVCEHSYKYIHLYNFMQHQWQKRVGNYCQRSTISTGFEVTPSVTFKWFPTLPPLPKPGTQPRVCSRWPCFLFQRRQTRSDRSSFSPLPFCPQSLAGFPPSHLAAWPWGTGVRVLLETYSIRVLEHSPACLLRDFYSSVSSFLPMSLIISPQTAHFCSYSSSLHVRRNKYAG